MCSCAPSRATTPRPRCVRCAASTSRICAARTWACGRCPTSTRKSWPNSWSSWPAAIEPRREGSVAGLLVEIPRERIRHLARLEILAQHGIDVLRSELRDGGVHRTRGCEGPPVEFLRGERTGDPAVFGTAQAPLLQYAFLGRRHLGVGEAVLDRAVEFLAEPGADTGQVLGREDRIGPDRAVRVQRARLEVRAGAVGQAVLLAEAFRNARRRRVAQDE